VPLPDDDDTLIAAATARHTPFRVLRILDGARQHWPAEPPVVSDSHATLRFGVATPRGARVVTLTLTRDPRDPHDPHDSQRLDDPDTSDDDLDAATDALDDEPDDIPDDSLDDDLHPAPWRLAALDSS
jgi:hypothetical protein